MHINLLTTLFYCPQDSKPDIIKIKPLWSKTRCQWGIFDIPSTLKSENMLYPSQCVWKPKVTCTKTSIITHFQSKDQYLTIFKINREHFNNQLTLLHNILANRSLLVHIETSWQLDQRNFLHLNSSRAV